MTAGILFVSHETDLGGAEHSLLDLLAHLDRTRFTPRLATSRDGPLAAAARALDVATVCVPLTHQSRPVKLWNVLRGARALRRLVARTGTALVHANTLIAGYPALPAARTTRRPVVWHVRDVAWPALARRLAPLADHLIANSEATARTLPEGARVSVVHNGVDARFFTARRERVRVRRAIGTSDATFVVATLGRLDPWKGHRVALDALPLVAGHAPDIELWIVGGETFGRSSRYPTELQEHAARLGVADRVRLLGPRDNAPAVLGAADVLVHPSIRPEPFGRSAAEAKAAGVPVVASDCGGLREIVRHEQDGLLFPPGDSAALARCLIRIHADPALRHRFAAAAVLDAERRFTSPAHGRRTDDVYAALLDATSAAS